MIEGKLPNSNLIEAAVQAGREAVVAPARIVSFVAESVGLHDQPIPVAIVPDGMKYALLTEVLGEFERRAPGPRRIVGTAKLTELDSFIDHVNQFKCDQSIVFASTKDTTLMAIYDYHDADQPAWAEHRSLYTCPLSMEWSRWKGSSSKLFGQDGFADFIEENLDDLTSPKDGEEGAGPVEILEMVRNLAIHTKGRFERKLNPTTGEHTMVCKEEHGESSTKIHRCFFLALPVFESGAKYRVEARIRFRLREGCPQFSFILHRSAEILADAFGQLREQIMEKTGLFVLAGTPE